VKNVCMAVSAYLPLAAQSGDLLRELARPPLEHVDSPASGPPGYGPQRMLTAYSFKKVRERGKGQVIAVVDAFDDPNVEVDLSTFTAQFSQPSCTTENGCFKLVYEGGTKPPADISGWSNEIAIDTQWAHSIAPEAVILLVEAQSNSFADLLSAVDTAVANGATIVSMSWVGSETADETSYDTHFNVPGVMFVAASGDDGHGVSYPAASPYVVGVGGTTLTINSNGTWESETAWSDSGGGQSQYETEPSYQEGVQTSGKRGVPDVAYDGNPSTGIPSYSSYSCGACYTGWQQWGGTSIGTPEWAALFARANAIRVLNGKAPLTEPQTILYPLNELGFHDITSGSNGNCGTLCTAGPGYDYVTGLGSLIADDLVVKLAGSQ